jgi:hypothetical protein
VSLCCRTESRNRCESRRGPVARALQRMCSWTQHVTDPDLCSSPARRQAEMRWCVGCALPLRLFRSAKNIAVLKPSSYHRITQELHGILVGGVNCTASRASTRTGKFLGQRRELRVKNQVRTTQSREIPSHSTLSLTICLSSQLLKQMRQPGKGWTDSRRRELMPSYPSTTPSILILSRTVRPATEFAR